MAVQECGLFSIDNIQFCIDISYRHSAEFNHKKCRNLKISLDNNLNIKNDLKASKIRFSEKKWKISRYIKKMSTIFWNKK